MVNMFRDAENSLQLSISVKIITNVIIGNVKENYNYLQRDIIVYTIATVTIQNPDN